MGMTDNGESRGDRDEAVAVRRRRIREAVRDVPDPEGGKLTKEDVRTLREAGLDDLAEVAEIYVRT
jgi:hypothetical protein